MASMLDSAVRASAVAPKALTFITTGASPGAMIRVLRLSQLANSSLTGLLQPGQMVTSSKLVQPLNTPEPTLVTVGGIGEFFSAEHPLKVLRAIVTHVEGRVKEVSSLQSRNELAAVATTVYSTPS